MQREGELVIFISKSVDGDRLCRLSFCLSKINGHLCVVIGGLQGPPAGHKREVIDATRDLFGLRPKDAVFLAARAIAKALHADRVYAVSDTHHVLARLQDRKKFSHYDSYWRERGGEAEGPYGFTFPPLGELADTGKGRDTMKIAISEGIANFVLAHRRRLLAAPETNARQVLRNA